MKILRKRIIQFGMIRSGSTLIYNILKELFPDRRISKTHKYRKNWKDAFLKVPIVATYRDPLDIICSSIKTHDDLANREIIKNHIKLLKVNGLDDFVKLDKRYKNKLNLKYEKFYNNFDYVFNKLEDFLDIKISSSLRIKIENKLSIQKVKEKIKEFKTFNEFDKNSHWHGNHISDNDGRIKSYLNYFSEDDIKYLKFIYKDFREEYILDK